MSDTTEATIDEAEYERVPIDQLIPHPQNPRQGDIAAIAESIKENGFYGALLVQRSTRFVCAGNHRLLAAQRLKMTELPVIWLDISDEKALDILLADNRTSDLGTYDQTTLAEILGSLPELKGTGYTEADRERILAGLDDTLDEMESKRKVEFEAVDKSLETDYQCPKCHYEWSGKPKP